MSNKIDNNIDLTDDGLFIDNNNDDNQFVNKDINTNQYNMTHTNKLEVRSSRSFVDEQYDYGLYIDHDGNLICKSNFIDYEGIYCLRCGIILTVNEMFTCIECDKEMDDEFR